MSFTSGRNREAVKIDFSEDEGLTEQQHKAASDIHTIMAKYENGQIIDNFNKKPGFYADLPSGLDFQTAQNLIAQAKSTFEEIPSKIRAEFGNDPAQFLDFIQDPKNRSKIESYGFTTEHLPPEPEALKTATADTQEPESAPTT